MSTPRYPSLYQINTRVWLTSLARELGRPVTLDDVSDAEIDLVAASGFDWVWLLSVWQTGPAGQRVSRTNPEWRREFEATLPDLCEDDIAGSGFAITGYAGASSLGGDAALARFRERMRARGLRLMLDFVPNHMALDHPWVAQHPEYFVAGTEEDLARAPANYTRVAATGVDRIFAYGRDPYFPGWPDTLQLDYSNPALQEAMIGELLKIAGQCDGVRCDMAMLVLPDVFERTWGRRSPAFWPAATGRVREHHPGFVFMAEVYWDLEWTLQQQGFNYTYDKRLYDRLREGHAGAVRDHLRADSGYQDRLARFLENHDEPRAAATFAPKAHEAAAVVTFLVPGLRFFHQGQLDGRRVRVSPHLVRAPHEPADLTLMAFYDRLLSVLRRQEVRNGDWRLLPCGPAWQGNPTWEHYIAYGWQLDTRDRLVVAVNAGADQGQCFVRLPFGDLEGRQWRLEDLLGDAVYIRDGSDLQTWGLFLDEPAWTAQVFALTPA
jgi:hypothetical protein